MFVIVQKAKNLPDLPFFVLNLRRLLYEYFNVSYTSNQHFLYMSTDGFTFTVHVFSYFFF
jgi:hypothetical protein